MIDATKYSPKFIRPIHSHTRSRAADSYTRYRSLSILPFSYSTSPIPPTVHTDQY